MDEIRAELTSLEEDLEAFVRARVEPGIARAVDARILERGREILAKTEGQLREAAARNDAQSQAQVRELRALTQAVKELRSEIGRLDDRLTRIERRAARDDGRPAAETRAIAVRPQPIQRAYALEVRRAPEAQDSGRRDNLMERLRLRRDYAIVGVLAAVVIGVVVWAVVFFNPQAAVRPPAPTPTVAAAEPAPTPPAAAPEASPPGLYATNPADLGLADLSLRSETVKALCGGKACAFAALWPALDAAARKALLQAAAEQVARPCAGRGAIPAASLLTTWRAAVACTKAQTAPKLASPADEETAARWLLAWIGSHP
jgi:hypothetical protein